MSFDTLRNGIVNNWPLGETPYDQEFNANLDFFAENGSPVMIDFRREPQSDPDYNLPGEDPPFSKINNATDNIEYWAWVFDMELGFDVLELQRTVVPWIGMVVGVRGDSAYAIYTADGWKHLFDFRSQGAMEVSIDCDFPRPNKTVASLFIPQPMVLGAGQRKSRVRPTRNKLPDVLTEFKLLKNGLQFGTVTIPGYQHSITSPTFAISATAFEAGDMLTIKAPENIHGITGLSFTLRFYGNL